MKDENKMSRRQVVAGLFAHRLRLAAAVSPAFAATGRPIT